MPKSLMKWRVYVAVLSAVSLCMALAGPLGWVAALVMAMGYFNIYLLLAEALEVAQEVKFYWRRFLYERTLPGDDSMTPRW